jgi:hypothetical protein
MKRLLYVISTFLFFQTAYSQTTEWGIKIGVQSTRFQGNDFYGRPAVSSGVTPEQVVTNANSAIGYAAGVYVRSRSDVFLHGEALISLKGGQLDRMTTGGKVSSKFSYGQLDLPLGIGYRYHKFEVMGGPLLSVQLFQDNKLGDVLSTYALTQSKFSPFTKAALGYHLSVGLQFDRLSVGVRNFGSIQNIASAVITYPSSGFDQSYFQQRFNGWQLSAAWKIR